MGFHISYGMALKATGWWVFLPALGVFLFAILSYIYAKKHPPARQRGQMTVLLTVIGIFLVGFGFLLPLSEAGTGWSLHHGTVQIETGFGTRMFPAKTLHSVWVSRSGPYALSVRTNGTSARYYHTGYYTLRNGKSALVFEYGQHPVLALFSPSGMGLLSTPGIRRLPRALASRTYNVNYPTPMPSRSSTGLDAAILMLVITLGIQAAMSLYYAPRLPEMVATHFGLSGKPSGYSSKRMTLWMGPILSFVFGWAGILMTLGNPGSLASAAPFLLMEVLIIVVFWWVFRLNISRP